MNGSLFLTPHARTLGTTINETMQAIGYEFVNATVCIYSNGKDRVYFGSVARFLNWFQVLSFAPPPVQPPEELSFMAEGRIVKW